MTDGSGAFLAGVVVAWQTADGSLQSPTTTTDQFGWARNAWVLANRVGRQELTASIPAETGAASAATARIVMTAVPAPSVIQLPDTIRMNALYQWRQPLVVRDAAGIAIPFFRVTWMVADSTIASVGQADPNNASLGGPVVQARGKNGTTTIRVASGTNPAVADSAVVVVQQVPARLTVQFVGYPFAYPSLESSFVVGETKKWSATAVDSGGFALTDPSIVTFASSDPAVLAVSDTEAKALAVGVATITAGWRGTEAYRATHRVFASADFGQVQTKAVGGGCTVTGAGPANTYLRGTSAILMAFKEDCFGGGKVESQWIGLPANTPFWYTPPVSALGTSTHTAMVTPDGTVMFARNNGNVTTFVAYAPDGTPKWQNDLPGGTSGTPPLRLALSANGTVLIRYADRLSAITETGIKWSVTGAGGDGIATLGDSVYALDNGRARLFDVTGQERWSSPIAGIPMQLAVARNGTLLVVSTSGVYAVSVTGTQQWSVSTLFKHLTVDANDNVIVAADTVAAAFDPAGQLRWTTTFPSRIDAHVIGDDGRVYFPACGTGYVYVVNRTSGAIEGRSAQALGGAAGTYCLYATAPVLMPGKLLTVDQFNVRWFDVRFGPSAGWSQDGGTSGRTNAVVR